MDMRNSVLGVAIKRRGLREGTRAVEFVIEWSLFMAEQEREPENVEEYAEWWNISPATAYRQQQSFREAFPEFRTPGGLLAACGYYPAKGEDVGLVGLGRTPLPESG